MLMKTQVAVLGAGPGGYPAAFRAADLGFDVVLIDREENPGGVCLYRGCIPSKTLLHAAELISEAKEAEDIGLAFSTPEIDIDKLRAWKSDVISKLTGGLGSLRKKRKINHIQGSAQLTGSHTMTVKKPDGSTETVEFEYAILASGSRPIELPMFDSKSKRVMTSTEALEIEDIPGSLLVVGGGYIGLELGSVYAALGTKVSVVEMLPALVPGADRDLIRPLETRLKKEFAEILLNTRVTGSSESDSRITVQMQNENDGSFDRPYDKVLLSVGRRPNTENIGLDNARIKIDERGFVITDDQKRTSEPHIFAVGDIAGQPMLAHKATHEGLVAAEAIAGRKTVFEPRAIPAVMFTNPEIAWCGITEQEAKEQKLDFKIGRFPWTASGRARTINRTDGLTKLIADASTGRIIGAGITGPGAGDMIAECVHAIEMGSVAEDLAWTIHPHPTLSESVMEAAESIMGHGIHSG